MSASVDRPCVYSLVVPVYRNEGSIPALVACVAGLDVALSGQLEAVFVVDGSPDRCYELLDAALPRATFRARLLLLSRNFGSFPAIRIGLGAATGRHFAVMAADLQEPPSLILDFFRTLESEAVDVTVGVRAARDDPFLSRIAAGLFWRVYRKLVQKEMPEGGVDIFGCNRAFRDHLLKLDEAHSSLVGLIFWLGFRRKELSYQRLPRQHGKSAWTFRRKLTYLMDSLFSFSDLPIRVLIAAGLIGLVASVGLSLIVAVAKVSGLIPVPGYAATAILISFFGGLNVLALGIVGSYTWRAYENTKHRPLAVALVEKAYPGEPATDPPAE
jgi:polyisoprenyl-phosphate glycosyltransferase